MKTENLLSYESLRMEAFRLLSECYYLPDPELSEKLKILGFNLALVCEPAAGFIQRMREEIKDGVNLELLKVDFSKLFVGPYGLLAAPYGSVYLDGDRKIMGDSTLNVNARYREVGVDMAAHFKDAPDHIAAELEFMYYLIFREIKAVSNSDTETAIDFLRKQKSFLEDHLLSWVPTFAVNIIENAETLFYQSLAKATERFLETNYKFVYSVLDSGQPDSEEHAEIISLRV